MKEPTHEAVQSLQKAVDRAMHMDQVVARLGLRTAPFVVEVDGIRFDVPNHYVAAAANSHLEDATAALFGSVVKFVLGLLESEAERDAFVVELQRWTP